MNYLEKFLRKTSFFLRNIYYKGYDFINLKRRLRGQGNKIINGGILRRVRIDVVGNGNELFIGKGSRISDVVICIRGDNHHLIIGERCVFSGGSFAFEDNNCKITIKDDTMVKSADLAASESDKSISIGRECLLANGIEVRTGDSHSIIDKTVQRRINPAKDVIIGDHVWIGAHVTVLKGVTIGKNSVIGARAVVTKDVPDNVVVAGVPAKIIKSNISWHQERT